MKFYSLLENQIHPDVKFGENVKIGFGTVIEEGCEVGDNTLIGHHVVIRNNWIIGNNVRIGHLCVFEPVGKIGDNVSIQSHSFICDRSTIEDWVFIGPRFVSCADKKMAHGRRNIVGYNPTGFTIKRGARIGGGCSILPCITIGENAVIGAGTVVTKNIPDRAIAIGIPAKVVGEVLLEECL